MPPFASILDLPAELHAIIFTLINAIPDLVSLAYTCQLFYDGIIMRGLHYRHIEINSLVDENDLWQHFCENPDISRQVRTLTICRGYPFVHEFPRHAPFLPRSSTASGQFLEQFRDDQTQTAVLLPVALRAMVNLESIFWDSPAPIEHVVWEALADARPPLRMINGYPSAFGSRHHQIHSNVLVDVHFSRIEVAQLTRIRLGFHIDDERQMDIRSLSVFLKSCHQLQALELAFKAFRANVTLRGIFTGLQFPKLKRLVVEGGNPTGQEMCDFILAHDTLEIIHFTSTNGAAFILVHPNFNDAGNIPSLNFEYLSKGSLPNLKSYTLKDLQELKQLARIGAPRLEELLLTKSTLEQICCDDRTLHPFIKSLRYLTLKNQGVQLGGFRADLTLKLRRTLPMIQIRTSSKPVWDDTDMTYPS